ncbi:MAG: CusA/CzcA family heavy metal efflux RND transporter [Pirellulaceae bacterium]|nr:CusA/CzcA family heavy metal efflux RND transporter [Pirellulaceae bacterium]
MLDAIIRFSLRQRLLVIAVAVFLLGYGGWQISELPIDVFPDLNRPRVTIMTEAHGMAPEEVETLITFPLETALNGATGVQAVRTASGVGLSVVWVEFDWGTDIYSDRQIVTERIALAAEGLPPGVTPQLAPISSVMGQIQVIGMWSDDGTTSPMKLRTLADWVVRQRLLTISGVSQVFVMGGDRKQFQVLVDPGRLLKYGVTLQEVKTALQRSNRNATGGYLDQQGPDELLVRSLGRIQTAQDVNEIVVTIRDGRTVLLGQVARIIEGAQVKRGSSAAFARQADGTFAGGPAVVLTVNKQPDADTRRVTTEITAALKELQRSLPEDVRIYPNLYQQKVFIDLAIRNVAEALRDGSILVVVVLFIFLLNLRTTFITLTAIPLSIVITGLVFHWFGLSINTMTLGGLAVAIGELVDDAIVDVENSYRRLRENRLAGSPLHPLVVVYRASLEVRNSIVFGTMIVILVFLPVFALGGMEGRLFRPVGVAYIVSILSSLLVSLTVTSVLCYWLLPNAKSMAHEKESVVLRGLKWLAGGAIGISLRAPMTILGLATVAVAIAGYSLLQKENDFLPPFNEGAVQINIVLPPGTSLGTSQEIAQRVEERLKKIDDLQAFVRKTGRAELDEHAVTVNISEIIASYDPSTTRSREEILDELREALADIPGIVTSVEQPLAHLISHMLSGVTAKIGIKLYGDDLEILRRKADELKRAISEVEGVTDLQVEPQIDIPQLRIQIDGQKLKLYGLVREDINEFVETSMNGEVVSEVLLGQRTFDLLVRLDESYREDLDAVRRLSIDLPGGGTTMLASVAKIYETGGPNTINRENVRRRIIIQCNTSGRGLVDVVQDIQTRIKPVEQSLPTGYFVSLEGQFESQRSASRMIAALFTLSLVGVFLVLYTMFHSVNLSLQVMIALPMAFIGSVAALYVTNQTLTVAAMVGFISLCGIASRNGILLINHYLHLVQHEGETWSREMIVRAGKERLAPVLMTALTSGIGLLPLAMAAGEPGKEILYPVATVIIGGLITSTFLEFLVRPALFWKFGMAAAKNVVEGSEAEVILE